MGVNLYIVNIICRPHHSRLLLKKVTVMFCFYLLYIIYLFVLVNYLEIHFKYINIIILIPFFTKISIFLYTYDIV